MTCTEEALKGLILPVVEQGRFLKTFEEEIDVSDVEEELKDLSRPQLLIKLIRTVQEYVPSKNGTYDSYALSAYADALYYLARQGYFRISFACGRRVIGEFIEEIERELKFLEKVAKVTEEDIQKVREKLKLRGVLG